MIFYNTFICDSNGIKSMYPCGLWEKKKDSEVLHQGTFVLFF